MPSHQTQCDFSRGAQLSALRRLRLPDGVAKDGSTVSAGKLLAVLRVIDDRCGKNGEQWWDQATLATQTGFSVRTLSKALQVLESMHLIDKQDTRRGGARRLVISIDWQTVFGDVEPFQDPTILATWGVIGGLMADGNGQMARARGTTPTRTARCTATGVTSGTWMSVQNRQGGTEREEAEDRASSANTSWRRMDRGGVLGVHSLGTTRHVTTLASPGSPCNEEAATTKSEQQPSDEVGVSVPVLPAMVSGKAGRGRSH